MNINEWGFWSWAALATILWMIAGALIEWRLYGYAVQVMEFIKLPRKRILGLDLWRLYPLIGAVIWPVVLWVRFKVAERPDKELGDA